MSDPVDERNLAYAKDLHTYFASIMVDGHADRVRDAWHWDTSSPQAYADSVADNREEWRRLINPPTFQVLGPARDVATEVPNGTWLEIDVHEHLKADGILVVPEGATKLVVFQHGLGSTPERVFGMGKPGAYHAVGQRLVDAGYAVLAPRNLYLVEPRNDAESMAQMVGTTVVGVELARVRVLLDEIAKRHPQLDPDNIAMTGLSWGGLATQYWTPLEPRFAVAATIGFYNDRLLKMAADATDPKFGSFLKRAEHHAYYWNQLGIFGDTELASLVCPRPFLVQHGQRDPIGWAPAIAEEFERSRRFWDELGVGDRAEIHIFDGGHEVDTEQLVRWLGRHFPADTQDR